MRDGYGDCDAFVMTAKQSEADMAESKKEVKEKLMYSVNEYNRVVVEIKRHDIATIWMAVERYARTHEWHSRVDTMSLGELSLRLRETSEWTDLALRFKSIFEDLTCSHVDDDNTEV